MNWQNDLSFFEYNNKDTIFCVLILLIKGFTLLSLLHLFFNNQIWV